MIHPQKAQAILWRNPKIERSVYYDEIECESKSEGIFPEAQVGDPGGDAAGVGVVTYRKALKKGELLGLFAMTAASYRDNQQLACYTDQLVEDWTKENKALLAERGDEILKLIGEELSKRTKAA